MQKYVVGYLFHESGQEVLLIRKQHPEWQKGKLNGVGGKVEVNEPPYQAMVREFHEEAGLQVREWDLFATIEGTSGPREHEDEWKLFFYKAFDTIAFDTADALTDEQLERVSVGDLPGLTTVPHLNFTVPMALYSDELYQLKERNELY
jgi:8-oxo-dGTP pyrophosphatase MutT (NUDIX family)